jgi:hypothetical protein
MAFLIFQLGGGQGAAFLGCPKSRFIWHQPPPPCYPGLASRRSKLFPWGIPVAKLVPPLSWPPRSASWVCLQKMLVTLSRQPVTGRPWGWQWNWLFSTDKIKLVPSASALISKDLKEPPKQKQKSIKHSGNNHRWWDCQHCSKDVTEL